MIHDAIEKESETGIPQFHKAMVMIEIATPRGTNNPKVRDTSNRAINLIINNLKGIFSETTILSIWPSTWWPNGAKLAAQLSVFVSCSSGKITRFLIKIMKSYEVFKNVIEGMEKDRGLTL